MKLYLHLELVDATQHLGFARKAVEASVIPSVGMEIEDLAWKGTRKVVGVTLNFEDGYAQIDVGKHALEDRARYPEEIKMYQSHGWQTQNTGYKD